MEGDSTLELSPLPLVPRQNRLDRMLTCLEEGCSSSSRHFDTVVADSAATQEADNERRPQARPLAAILDEVSSKGPILVRVEALERVLQLYHEMEQRQRSEVSSVASSKDGESFGRRGRSAEEEESAEDEWAL